MLRLLQIQNQNKFLTMQRFRRRLDKLGRKARKDKNGVHHGFCFIMFRRVVLETVTPTLTNLHLSVIIISVIIVHDCQLKRRTTKMLQKKFLLDYVDLDRHFR